MSQLSEMLMEDFYGKLTERTLGKNLRTGDMARRITNCASTHLLGHIVTKEQDAVGVSFRRSRPAAEETCTLWMRLRMIKVSFGCYLTFVINSCSQSMIFGNVSQRLEKGKRFQKICMTKCCMSKDIDINAKQGSKEDIAKLNTVSKALKASSTKALRDFQRRQLGTLPTLLDTHYNRIYHRLRKNNSTIVQQTQLEQEHAPIEVRGDDFAECDVEIQNEAVEFEENVPLTVFRKSDLIACGKSDGYCFNVIELTNDIDFKKMTSRSKVKGNILPLHCEDEEDAVIF